MCRINGGYLFFQNASASCISALNRSNILLYFWCTNSQTTFSAILATLYSFVNLKRSSNWSSVPTTWLTSSRLVVSNWNKMATLQGVIQISGKKTCRDNDVTAETSDESFSSSVSNDLSIWNRVRVSVRSLNPASLSQSVDLLLHQTLFATSLVYYVQRSAKCGGVQNYAECLKDKRICF